MNLTGQEFELSFAEQKCTIAETGALLKSYTVAGVDVIVPFKDTLPPFSSGQVLFPYPNRLQDGQYTFAGQAYQMPINEIDKHNQLHGIVVGYNFELLDQKNNEITLGLHLPATAGYPFLTELKITYSLNEQGLNVHTNIKNLGQTNAPVGLGFHPWLNPMGSLDDCNLEFTAAKWIATNERLLPTEQVVVPEKFNFSQIKSLKNTAFDDAFVNVKNNKVIFTTASNHTTTVWSDANFPVWQICSGDGFPDGKDRFGLAVEPMTCAANAFRSEENLLILKPDEIWQGTWGIQFK